MVQNHFPKWMARALFAGALSAAACPAQAEPRAVVELFTSQGCSSCPPADRIIGELSKDPSIVALSLPIDYWDYLGWKDTLADSRFTQRQKAYSRARSDRNVYTPQVVVNGVRQVIGSDHGGIERAIETSKSHEPVMSVPVSMAIADKHIEVTVAAAAPGAVAEGEGPARGEVWICAVSKAVPITIARGENRGKQVVYHNVVRNMLKVGDWDGRAANWSVPIENLSGAGIDAAAVIVQDGNRDRPGPMLGAAFTSLR